MNEEQDIQLIQQCLQGSKKAFESIVDKYQKPIFNVALRILNDTNEAEDITQSVFIKAYENLSDFNVKYKLFSWLYRIAINESLNFQNSRRRNETLHEGIVADEKTPEELFQDKQANQTIHKAVNRLKIEYQTVIILKHFQGLSYSQISEILDIPEKTVKSRLFSARQQLKDILIKQL